MNGVRREGCLEHPSRPSFKETIWETTKRPKLGERAKSKKTRKRFGLIGRRRRKSGVRLIAKKSIYAGGIGDTKMRIE